MFMMTKQAHVFQGPILRAISASMFTAIPASIIQTPFPIWDRKCKLAIGLVLMRWRATRGMARSIAQAAQPRIWAKYSDQSPSCDQLIRTHGNSPRWSDDIECEMSGGILRAVHAQTAWHEVSEGV